VVTALKLLIDRRNPMTSGTLRAIDLIVPPGAVFNPYPPQACQFYQDIVMAIVHAIFRALNPVLGDEGVSSGLGPFSIVVDSMSGAEEYPEVLGSLAIAGGPWGATRTGDADSGQQPIYTNLSMTGGVEGVETMFPAGVVLRGEYVPDTCGPGKNRGGAANVYELLARTDVRLQPLADKPSGGGGVQGGGSGTLGTFRRLETTDPDRADCLFHPDLDGPIGRLTTSGGGGWGDPFTRDPELVKRDVRDGYVSIDAATRDYGVVVVGDPARYPERLEIDWAATDELRRNADNGATQRQAPADDEPDPSELGPMIPELEPVEGSCASCGAAELRKYPLLAADGWFEVVKCRSCLRTASRTPWYRLGWVRLAEDEL
jgi:N-methylhydantoinase B